MLTSSVVWSYKEDFFLAVTLNLEIISSRLKSKVGIVEYFILRCQGGGEEFINHPSSHTLSKRRQTSKDSRNEGLVIIILYINAKVVLSKFSLNFLALLLLVLPSF